jgi:predicted CopG family antitoxin
MSMHVYTYMATKTISITREAYDRLRSRKGPNDSFSDVILRLTARRPLAEYAGMLDKSSAKAIRSAIEEARRERRGLDTRA